MGTKKAAQAEILSELIQSLVEDVEQGVDIFLDMRDYKQFNREDTENTEFDDSDMFNDLSTLTGIDDTFIVSWLKANTDMTIDDIVGLNKKGKGCLLVSVATQVPLKAALPPCSKVK